MVYIILVNWNGWRDLIECLESLLRLDFENYAILVCDNGSTDGSFQRVQDWSAGNISVDRSPQAWSSQDEERRLPPWPIRLARPEWRPAKGTLTWLEMGRNAGFAAANNAGLRLALTDPAMRYAWLLNSDTIVKADALTHLVERAGLPPKADLIGSTLCLYHSPKKLQALGVAYNLALGRGKEILRDESADSLPSRDWVEARLTYIVGASMLVSRRFVEQIGFMQENYFLYFEEIDWAVRAKGKMNLGWSRDSIVFHKEGGSIGSDGGARPSNTSLYYLTVNTLRFSLRHRPIYLPLIMSRLLFVAARYATVRDAAALAIMAMAIADFVSGRSRIGPIAGG
ncbi:glycosyltransferase [Caulobacter sp. ErkDOM-YI]|uniref:glycosyltransferase n=1 Tax=unclassified Caulobacter TaxID=2648921 RepID=UPI003AF9BB2B